jgi:hypothetical protein
MIQSATIKGACHTLKRIETTIEINSKPDRVWQVLIDFASFSQWNPFIREAEGEPKEGSEVRISLKLSGEKEMHEGYLKVLKVEPTKEISFRAQLPGLFRVEHTFRLESIGGNRTRFIQLSIFSGFVNYFVGDKFRENFRKGFEEMEHALKEKVERSSSV